VTDIEHELIATQWDLKAAKDRIKLLEKDSQRLNWLLNILEKDSQRLNWLLSRGLAWRDCYNDWWKEGEWLYASQSARETIDKAKEAKP
jgi:hypothetical protein